MQGAGKLSPIQGVKYVAEMKPSGKTVAITWYAPKGSDAWGTILEAVRALPRRKYNAATKRWEVPATPECLQWLVDAGFPASMAELSRGTQQPVREVPAVDPVKEQRERIAAMELDPSGTLIPGLRPYQVDFLKFAQIRHGRVALGDDMGTGKTVQSLAWMVYAKADPALIVVNAPTKLQWMSAYYRWVGSVPGVHPRVSVLRGRTPYWLEKGVSYIINWDILPSWEEQLSQMGFRLLIGDEVQAIGNPKSQRARAFMRLARCISQVIGMSGTPAMSRPAQFWPLLNIMEPSVFGNHYRFLQRYCRPRSNGFGVTYDGASHVEELHSLLVKCMLRRTKEEVMGDLPPKVMEVVPLEVDMKAMEEYRAQEATAFREDGVSSKEMRERVAGLLRTAYALKEPALMQWVRDFLDSGRKLLLFAWHRDVVDLIHLGLRDWKPARLYGGMSTADREAARSMFINDPDCRVMVANIQSGGVGIDGFQDVCSDVAFAEFSHTPLYHRQAEDRLHRSGQRSSVTSYYLVAPGTVDMDAVEVLDDRAKMLDGVLDGKEAADIDLLTELMERRGLRHG
jgi:SWI/SNF-related matrix-associated actin-dependent regulator 1 of chromatin subfamily A